MRSKVEIELKWALTAAAHEALSHQLGDLLGAPERLDQENRFFDSADLRLRRNLLNLRLRRENNTVVLTCKGKLPHGDHSAHQHHEWEMTVDPALWSAVEAKDINSEDLPIPDVLRQALNGAPLVDLGGFQNARLNFYHKQSPSAVLSLDRTVFSSSRVDYELEIETEEAAASAQLWQEHLRNWNIEFAEQPQTKFARFLLLSAQPQ